MHIYALALSMEGEGNGGVVCALGSTKPSAREVLSGAVLLFLPVPGMSPWCFLGDWFGWMVDAVIGCFA